VLGQVCGGCQLILAHASCRPVTCGTPSKNLTMKTVIDSNRSIQQQDVADKFYTHIQHATSYHEHVICKSNAEASH